MKQAPIKLRFAVVAVDIVVFSFIDGELHALVSPVHRPPHYLNTHGFLGGIIKDTENTDEAAVRILKEKGDLSVAHIEQLYTFSRIDRDKRNRVVSVGYIAFVLPEAAQKYAHGEAYFAPVSKLKKLAYDHDEMLMVATERLQGKVSYTTIAKFLLDKTFTLSELQQVYESVLQTKFDKRNFRKKILSLGIIAETGERQSGVKNRPASLYTFVHKKISEISLMN
jgi:8-oxo-dGTP diphosphatase